MVQIPPNRYFTAAFVLRSNKGPTIVVPVMLTQPQIDALLVSEPFKAQIQAEVRHHLPSNRDMMHALLDPELQFELALAAGPGPVSFNIDETLGKPFIVRPLNLTAVPTGIAPVVRH